PAGAGMLHRPHQLHQVEWLLLHADQHVALPLATCLLPLASCLDQHPPLTGGISASSSPSRTSVSGRTNSASMAISVEPRIGSISGKRSATRSNTSRAVLDIGTSRSRDPLPASSRY